MTSNPLLAFLHILLMVFWIGTDIGVFIAGFYLMDARLSIPQRQTAIGLGMVIDRFPRLCFVALLPVGVQMAVQMHALNLPGSVVLAMWSAAVVWLSASLWPMFRPSSPLNRLTHGFERMMQVLTIAILIGGATVMLAGSGPGWLAVKLLMFAVACAAVIPLELAFAAPMAAFGEICAEGTTPERETRLRHGMYWTYVWVLTIYVAVLAAAYLGVAKPF